MVYLGGLWCYLRDLWFLREIQVYTQGLFLSDFRDLTGLLYGSIKQS
jgi:hypothetical protein